MSSDGGAGGDTPAGSGAGGNGSAGSGAEGIGDGELLRIFAGLERYATISLAVSGGSDSLAMMHLVAQWRRQHAKLGLLVPPLPLVLTVDHRLRPEAADEARLVASEAGFLGFPHETLIWEGDKPESGLQAAAREARYRLMAQRLATCPAPIAILTAHTQSDQAETLLMRLARGSGLEGLSGMARRRALSDTPRIDLVRPLLDISADRLRETLRTPPPRQWVEDPTNADLHHERPRWRASQPALSALGLTDAPLARSARRLRRACEAIQWATHRLADTALREVPGLSATIDAAALFAAPAELRIQLIAKVLDRYGGSHPQARLSEVERLMSRLERDEMGLTLGGCQVRRDRDRIVVWREVGRDGLPAIVLRPGERAVWDQRFEVFIGPPIEPGQVRPETFVVRALNPAEWAALTRAHGLSTPRDQPLLTAPAVVSGEMAGNPAAAQILAHPLAGYDGTGRVRFNLTGLTAFGRPAPAVLEPP